jgi:hypothetical protein
VFVGVEKTKERRFFAITVDNRNAETLNDLIIKYVLPGSIVVTDGCKGFLIFKINAQFEHHVGNHSIFFKTQKESILIIFKERGVV